MQVDLYNCRKNGVMFIVLVTLVAVLMLLNKAKARG